MLLPFSTKEERSRAGRFYLAGAATPPTYPCSGLVLEPKHDGVVINDDEDVSDDLRKTNGSC